MFFFGRFIQRIINSCIERITAGNYLVFKRKQFLTFLSLATLKRKDFSLNLATAMVVNLFSKFPLTFLYMFFYIRQLLLKRESLVFCPLLDFSTFLIDKFIVAQSNAFIESHLLRSHLCLQMRIIYNRQEILCNRTAN